MVSKLHLSPMSVKKFKKVHVLHKAYVAKIKKVEPVEEEPAVVEAEKERPVVSEPVVETETNVSPEEIDAPKKPVRRKKVAEENNEENTESHE